MIYNIPIKWTQKPNTASYPEYDGIIDLKPFGQGNTVQAKWGALTSTSVTGGSAGDVWWSLTADATLKQGTQTIKKQDRKSWSGGNYVPAPFRPGQSSSQNYNFEETLILASSYTIELTQDSCYSSLTPSTLIPLDVLSVTTEKPNTFTKIGTTIFQPVTVKWNMDSNNLVDYEVLQAGKQIMSANGVNVRSITIPSGTLKSTENVTINVRSHFTWLGTKYTSEWVAYTISGLKDFTATDISNFRYVGTTKNIEEPMIYAWENVSPLAGVTNKATLQIWQDGYLKYEKTGITSCTDTIPAYTLTSTNNIQVKVKNISTYGSYTATSSEKTLSISDLKTIKPVIIDFNLATNNRDYDITVTHNSTGATEFAIEYANKRRTGLVIPKDTLLNGSCSITFVAIATSSQGNKVETKLTKSFSIIQDEPNTYSLEPQGLNMNIEQPILVSFITSDFVDRWELYLPNGIKVDGTKSREHLCPSGTFSKGVNTITVKTFYRDSRTHTKTSTFTGYGTPNKPIMTVVGVYNTALPTFSWVDGGSTDSDLQTGYDIKVIDVESHSVINSKEESTTIKTFKCISALSNNKVYRVELKVKNKYGMWSLPTVGEFITQFTDLPIPLLKLYNNGDNVLISIETETQPANFKECKIYKKEGRREWVEIGDKYNSVDNLLDYAIAPNVEVFYKCRLFDTNGSFSESANASTSVKVSNFNLFSVENPEVDNINLDFVKPAYNVVTNKTLRKFSGNSKPTPFGDSTNYITAQLTIVCEDDELQKLLDVVNYGKVFCYRTWKGRKYYVSAMIESITPLNRAFNSVSMILTEINFNEELMYQGKGMKKLTYFNGEYYMDGTIDMSGQIISYSKGGGSVGTI